jgi:hypothetical protein
MPLTAAWEIYVEYAGNCFRKADACKDEDRKALIENAKVWLAKAEAVIEQTAKRPVFSVR